MTHSIEEDSLCMKNLLLNDDHIRAMYPKLAECGFSEAQILEIIRAWHMKNRSLDHFHDELEKAEWDVRENPGKFDKSACSYVYSALLRGPYAAPKGFKYVRELQEEERAAAAQRRRELHEKRIEDEFYVWWSEKSREDKAAIDREITKSHPEFSHLKNEELKRELRKAHFQNATE